VTWRAGHIGGAAGRQGLIILRQPWKARGPDQKGCHQAFGQSAASEEQFILTGLIFL